jgi:hypothetical protein
MASDDDCPRPGGGCGGMLGPERRYTLVATERVCAVCGCALQGYDEDAADALDATAAERDALAAELRRANARLVRAVGLRQLARAWKRLAAGMRRRWRYARNDADVGVRAAVALSEQLTRALADARELRKLVWGAHVAEEWTGLHYDHLRAYVATLAAREYVGCTALAGCGCEACAAQRALDWRPE